MGIVAEVARAGPAAAGAAPKKKTKKATKKITKKAKKTMKQFQPRADAAAAEREAAQQAAEEAARRARHLSALSRPSGPERELEELVFGDSLNVEEDELLQRLAGPQRVGLGPAAGPGPGERGGRRVPRPRAGAGEGFGSRSPCLSSPRDWAKRAVWLFSA